MTLSVFALDAIVVAHTTFDSSANYRSAVLRGSAIVLDETRQRRTELISDRLIPGRRAEIRPSTRREIAATVVLALPIEGRVAVARPLLHPELLVFEWRWVGCHLEHFLTHITTPLVTQQLDSDRHAR